MCGREHVLYVHVCACACACLLNSECQCRRSMLECSAVSGAAGLVKWTMSAWTLVKWRLVKRTCQLDLSSGACPHGHPTTPARPQVQRPEPEDIKQRADNPGPADYADPAPPWAKLGKSGVAVKIGTEEQRPWPIHPETLTKIAQPDDMPGSPDCPRVTRRE